MMKIMMALVAMMRGTVTVMVMAMCRKYPTKKEETQPKIVLVTKRVVLLEQ